jgi:hypothetical protein
MQVFVLKYFPPKETKTEYCFAMTSKPWNFHHKHNIIPAPPIARPMSVITTSDTRHWWMGDTGSSCHITNDDTGMFQWKHINHPIQVGDGSTIYATK